MRDTLVSTPIDFNIVRKAIQESKLKSVGRASIREILSLINVIERETGMKFVRMEMGIPGLEACEIGITAEQKALKTGIASKYPSIEGIPELKKEISRFVNLFLDIDIPPQCCIPCTGSTNGSFLSFLVATRFYPGKNAVLFLDPGFPVHKQQLSVLGIEQKSVDVYDFRGEKLRDKLESILREGTVSALLYSNPNNPAWICFTDQELRIIGELCSRYNVICIEDLAYFCMDFRNDYSKPGKPPHQPSAARYTDNFILLISSSKIFSYAGQRIGSVAISEKLFNSDSDSLMKNFNTRNFGHAFIYGAAYAVSAGITHSTQYALAAMLKAASDSDYNFVDVVKVYGERAQKMKKIFLKNGFSIVYDKDDGQPIADGFYFTISYPGYSGEQLIEELLYYGVSAISLSNTGSLRREGIRACVSLVPEKLFPELDRRLGIFKENNRMSD